MNTWLLLLVSVPLAEITLLSQTSTSPAGPKSQQELQDFERQFNAARNDPARLTELKSEVRNVLSTDDLKRLEGMLAADEAAQRPDPTATNPTYSSAIFRGLDPNTFLEEIEARLNAASNDVGRIWGFSAAAKAALEAGQNDKAKTYALQAITLADQKAAHNSASHNHLRSTRPRCYDRIAFADFYGNLVPGRLAVLNGDFRAAEQYMIASGQTCGTSDAALSSYGPNMSLALELLKKGDEQSRQAVLQFLKSIGAWWNQPGVIKQWEDDIRSGARPNFLSFGPNLY